MKDIFYEALKDTSNTVYAQIQEASACRLHFHRAFELAYIAEGRASYEVEGKRFVADTDHIVFSHRYYSHRSFDDLAHKKIVIAIPENMSYDISKLLSSTTLPSLLSDKQLNRTVMPYFKALLTADESTPEILIKGYVNLIFGTLTLNYSNVSVAPTNKNISVIVSILDYIDKHATEPITLETLASRFGYNKSYFSRMFNSSVGVSLSNYINFVRLSRFEANLKQNGDKSITEQIFEAGFQSVPTFYRIRGLKKEENRQNKAFT
ncbi:MAG: helix-turn-helix transcriptional regulator [Clostridia bacterium]|nr:helix-turn-helix transcriptional regulator [Clostridia bacterium]